MQLRAQLRERAMADAQLELRDHQSRVRQEVHEAPSRITMLNAMLNAAQSLGMPQESIDRMIKLRAHHNNRYNQHTTQLGAMVKKKGAEWIEELVGKYEDELTPDGVEVEIPVASQSEPDKEADK